MPLPRTQLFCLTLGTIHWNQSAKSELRKKPGGDSQGSEYRAHCCKLPTPSSPGCCPGITPGLLGCAAAFLLPEGKATDSHLFKVMWESDRVHTEQFSAGLHQPTDSTWVQFVCVCVTRDFPGGSDDKESACNAGEPGSIPGLGRSPGEGNSYPLQ